MVHWVDEQKVAIFGAKKKRLQINGKKTLNVSYLRTTTKMSPPCELEVAFPT